MLDDEYQPGANAGNADPMRTAVGGDIPPAGPARLLAARSPQAPAGPDPNRAYAMSMATQAKPNGGGPSVNPTPYGGPFGSYTGRSGQGPRQARVPSSPASITQPQQGAALESFMAQHPAQRGGQGPQQSPQGGQQSGGPAEDESAEAGAGEAAEAGAEGAGAGAAEGGAGIVEALGLQ